MTVAISKLSQLAFRRLGSRVLTGVRHQECAFADCQRQKERRHFHESVVWRKERDAEVDDEEEGNRAPSRSTSGSTEKPEYQFSIDELNADERARYEAFSPAEQKIYRDERKYIYDTLSSSKADSMFQRMVSQSNADYERDAPHVDFPQRRPIKSGFWNYGELEREDSGEDEEYEGDDLNELGHAELEQHREIRHYARIAAWEMPLLSKFATPFKPPDMEHILRFRYTTYMGEEHPAAKKIVLEFCPADLPGLTEAQRTKFIKLVGPRYNPETDVVKMSSEMFETQAQNKRYLGDLVDTLMVEAKDASDMFEDVPLDFRHHRFKKRLEFPDDWKLTPARKMQLEQEWRRGIAQEEQKMIAGNIVDGGKILQEAMAAMPVRDDSRLLAEQRQGGKRGGPRQMLR